MIGVLHFEAPSALDRAIGVGMGWWSKMVVEEEGILRLCVVSGVNIGWTSPLILDVAGVILMIILVVAMLVGTPCVPGITWIDGIEFFLVVVAESHWVWLLFNRLKTDGSPLTDYGLFFMY